MSKGNVRPSTGEHASIVPTEHPISSESLQKIKLQSYISVAKTNHNVIFIMSRGLSTV